MKNLLTLVLMYRYLFCIKLAKLKIVSLDNMLELHSFLDGGSMV